MLLSSQLIFNIASELSSKQTHTLAEVLRGAIGRGIAFDSRQVLPGDIFFAWQGEQQHGITYAEQALAAGAAFLVSDLPHPMGILVDDPQAVLLELARRARAQYQGPIIGVTGSAGKTSSKAMIAAALAADMSPGNLNTPFALAKVLIEQVLRRATPESKRPLVLELGIDHQGEMDMLVDIVRPSHAVLTLIGSSHLSGLGDVASVAQEKCRIFQTAEQLWVSADALELAQPYIQKALAEGKTLRSYGLDSDDQVEQLDVCATISERSPTNQHILLDGKSFVLPYVSAAMAKNSLVAIDIARRFGVADQAIADRLANVVLEDRRLQRHPLGDFLLIDDSYNSNPESLQVALDVVQGYPRPYTLILGDMLELGQTSNDLHSRMGRACAFADSLLCLGDEAMWMARGHPKGRHFAGMADLLAHLSQQDLKGTVLVKASRGMRFERVVDHLLQCGLEAAA